jgi:PGF-CTERM protein
VLPAAANTVVPAGGTVFRGEEGLNIAAGMPAAGTLAWFAPGSTPGIDAPSKTVSVANPLNFYVDPSMETGAWYDNAGLFTTAAILVADPAIDIQIRNAANDIVNDKTIIRGDPINFRIVSNLDAFTARTTAPSAAPATVYVTDPNGNVYTSLMSTAAGTPLIDLSASATNPNTQINNNPFVVEQNEVAIGAMLNWDTGAAPYSRGTYTIKVECNANSMNDNYDVVGKTVSKSYSLTIADDDLTITSNMDNVVRNNDFAVTIEGRPSTNYVLWVKGTSTLTPAETPQIKSGQQGVSLDAGAGTAGNNAGLYSFAAAQTVAADTPSGLILNSPFYAMVNTNSAGKRTVGFSTTQNTKDQSFTIRTDRYVAPGPSGDYDEVKVRVEKGEVTITASGDRSYYLGEEVTLSGTNTDSSNVYLFITGPNLPPAGAQLTNPAVAVVDGPLGTGLFFIQRTVKSDDTWEYKWDTSGLALDAGTYTIYAVADSRDKDNLANNKYETVSVVIRKGFVSATASQSSVAKGDKFYIRGNAEGDPSPGVAIWILGRNFAVRDTETVEDDSSFEYEVTSAVTQGMASGQYFVVVQHPMGNNRFDVVETTVGATDYAAMLGTPIAPGVASTNYFPVVGPGRLQGSDAAEALIQLLNNPNVDDTYTKMTFLVEEPWIRIDSIGDKTVGSTFTITGTTNLGVDNDLLVEVTSSAFQPTEKTQATAFSGSSGTVKVVKGDAGANTWSFEVDASAFDADEYIVTVESIEADASTTANFNVLEAVPVTQPPATQPPATQPPATTPPTEVPATPASPGFGALVAIAGLGAVAFLVLRRD